MCLVAYGGKVRTLPLARSVVDPSSHRRGEPLEVLAARPGARTVLVRQGRVATTPDGAHLDLWEPARLSEAGLPPSGTGPGLWFYLGEHDGAAYLGVLIDDPAEGGPDAGDDLPAGCTWSMLREVGHVLADLDADLATTAVALSEWHRRTTRCPRCGAVTRTELAGWVRRCPEDGGEEHPRTDAAVIMAVTDDADRILLAHGAHWAPGRFSTLAGFVEPGESLETAVRREVAEEVGVEVGEVTYVGSQPWPFPASLMVGFRARALTTAITLDAQEVTDARWFTRAELHAAVRDGEVGLPRATSIALALIEEWYGGPIDVPPSA